MYVFIQHLRHGLDVTQGQFSSGVKLVWIQELFFFYTGCLTKFKEHSLPYYLPIAVGRPDDLCLSRGY